MLAFACAFTMFAGAASFTDQADINTDNVEAVDLLTTLGIIKGYEDGSFDPEGTVDRAEMAKMIYTIRNGGNDDASAYESVTTSFTDISGHWAEGYIKYLQNTGIVAGKSATKFDPDSQVTTGEAMKMALALAGYDEVNAGLTGTAWLNNTVSLATTYGLTDDVASAISGGCSRQDAAQILANALGMTAVRYSSIVENFVNDSENGLSWGGDPISVGRKWMDLYTNIGTLLNIDGKELVLKMSDSDKADSDAKNIDTFINLSKDYSDLLGQKVKVLFDSGKNNAVIGVFAIDDNTVVTANQNAISVDTGKLKIDGTKYTIEDDGVVVYKDGSPEDTNYKAGDFTADQSANVITFIDSDDNDKIDTAYIKTYEVAQVSYASASQIIAGGKTYEADEENIAEGLAKDDWIIITHNLYNTNLDIVKADVVTGTVNATKDKGSWKQFQIDEIWYNETNSPNGDVQSNVKAGVDAEYVALNGILFYAKKVTVSTDHLSDVLFVAYHGTDGLANNQARVMFPNGTEETIDLKNNYVETQAGANAGPIANGAVYEYYKSGSKYQLVQLDNTADAYGDYSVIIDSDSPVDGVLLNDGAKGDITSVEGVTIDDSADVVVFTANSGDATKYSVKHITGKQLKQFEAVADAGNTNDNIKETVIAAFKSSVNGLTRATALFVTFDSNDGSFHNKLDNLSAYAHYGFITKDAVRVGSDQIKFNVWTGTEDVEVYADQTNETKFTKGTIIGYDSITAEDGKNIIDSIFQLTTANGVVAGSITSARNDGEKFVVGGTEYDVDNFSTVLYVNTSDNETIGIVDGKATAAHDPLKDSVTLATNILYYGKEVAVIDVNEIAGETYASNTLFDDTADSTYYVNEISDFSSVEWLNNRTGDTDNTKAYDNAQMTLSFYSKKAGTLTLSGVKGAPMELKVVAGTNEFEDIYVTGNVTATWSGAASTSSEFLPFGTVAQGGTAVSTLSLPNALGQAITWSVKKDNVAINTSVLGTITPALVNSSNGVTNVSVVTTAATPTGSYEITATVNGVSYTSTLTVAAALSAVTPTTIGTANGLVAPADGIAINTTKPTLTSSTDFTVDSLVWKANGVAMNAGDTFTADTVYTAELTLKAASGKKFVWGTEPITKSATVQDIDASTQLQSKMDATRFSDTEVVVVYTFSKLPITRNISASPSGTPTGTITGDPSGNPTLAAVTITSDGTLATSKAGDKLTINVAASGVPAKTTAGAYTATIKVGDKTYTVDNVATGASATKIVFEYTLTADDIGALSNHKTALDVNVNSLADKT